MELEMEFGEFTPESVLEFMLRGKAEWGRISAYTEWILLKKRQALLHPKGSKR